MTAPYGSYGDDSGASRYGYGGGQSYTEYGARQAAEARLHASGAIPYLRPEASFYPGPNASTSSPHPERREVRPSRSRPRSLPPSARRQRGRFQEHSPSISLREASDPIRRAHGFLKETFSNSTSGLGVGVLGAVRRISFLFLPPSLNAISSCHLLGGGEVEEDCIRRTSPCGLRSSLLTSTR